MNPHQPGMTGNLHLGRVVDNVDPEQRGRVRVQLVTMPISLWASVIVPSAGHGYGVSMIPRLNEMVALGFIDQDNALVLGSVWSGDASHPDAAEPVEQRYVISTPSGAVIEMDDQGPSVEMRTAQGARIRIDDAAGGAITMEVAGQTVTAGPSGVVVRSSGEVEVQASMVKISAGMVQVEAGISRFSGVVQADTVITNAVVSSSYTPGAGNIW